MTGGSASPDLIRGASETLAGRVAFVHLSGFDVTETGAEHADRLWERGGFPMSFLAPDDTASYAWRQDFIETFLSRDAARFGITLPPEQLRRFSTDRGRAAGPTFAASGRVVTDSATLMYHGYSTCAGPLWRVRFSHS